MRNTGIIRPDTKTCSMTPMRRERDRASAYAASSETTVDRATDAVVTSTELRKYVENDASTQAWRYASSEGLTGRPSGSATSSWSVRNEFHTMISSGTSATAA
jgi:hypothetical protein